MKKLRTILTYISSCRMWLIILACVNLFFIFLAWLAYPEKFYRLVWLMFFVSLAAFAIPLTILIKRHENKKTAFHQFLLDPDEANEYLLCKVAPVSMHSYIHELERLLREQQTVMDNCNVQIKDYERYIESWVHEIKKPLSLMALVLDNRKEEIPPLVRTRMLHVCDEMRGNVEQILYFSRLGATHKDYFLEPLSILSLCKESIEDNLTLLEESGFAIEFSGEEYEVVSDKKGLMFILGQIISNSVKYSEKQNDPLIRFTTIEDTIERQTILSITDNGPGVPLSDMPFIFDKGFTGDTGSYLSRSTGMGLFLVQKMAYDLAIELKIASSQGAGMTLSLAFPKVQQS
ncbi:MAG: sensor histidine kinase [Brevefilum sp.]|jgi:two-component system sensor histidine kinase GraS